jgi:hypothetical protein
MRMFGNRSEVPPRGPVREALVVIGAFSLLTLIAAWPLARRAARALPGDLRDPLLNAWILAWDADRLRHLLRGLWDAPMPSNRIRRVRLTQTGRSSRRWSIAGISLWRR